LFAGISIKREKLYQGSSGLVKGVCPTVVTDISDAYIPKNNLLPEDRFERYRPEYVSVKEAGGKSVEKDPWEF
jgi:hypothetical protein